MPIIGNNNIQATSSNFGTNAFGIKLPAMLYTAAAGDQVTAFYCYGGRGPGVSVTMAIYTVTAGLPDVQIGGSTNIPMLDLDAWYTAAPGAPINLVAGTTYAVAFTGTGFPRVWYDALADAISNNAGGLTDPWVNTGSIWQIYSAYALVVNAAPTTPTTYYPCKAQLIT